MLCGGNYKGQGHGVSERHLRREPLQLLVVDRPFYAYNRANVNISVKDQEVANHFYEMKTSVDFPI